MRILFILSCLLLLPLNLSANEKDDKQIAELSKKVEELNRQLDLLTQQIKEQAQDDKREESSDTTPKEQEQSTKVSDKTPQDDQIDKLLKAVESISKNQEDLKRQLSEIQTAAEPVESVETVENPEVIYTDDSDQEILYEYGNVVGESEPKVIYVNPDPVYVREPIRYYSTPKYGFSFSFGNGSNYWNRNHWRYNRNHRRHYWH